MWGEKEDAFYTYFFQINQASQTKAKSEIDADCNYMIRERAIKIIQKGM